MWRHQDVRGAMDGDPHNEEQARSEPEALKTLAELNEQCLELLREQALLNTANAPPMFRDLATLWQQFDDVARRRAATCPFLLVDAGFADPFRWKWVAANFAGDREPGPYTAFFTGKSAVRAAHQVFTNAWYIARTYPSRASLYLGMPPRCVNLLKSCSLRQVTELANRHYDWLRPRWAGRVRIWKEMLLAAISSQGVSIEMARLHGVQLLAMELRALEQVNQKDER